VSEGEAKKSFASMKPCCEGIRPTTHRTWAVRRMHHAWSGRGGRLAASVRGGGSGRTTVMRMTLACGCRLRGA
jgi:hypothetical protein